MFTKLTALFFLAIISLQATAHQDWRLLISACSGCSGGTAEVIVQDIEMYDAAGVYLPLGGTASADRSDNGTSAANVFDRASTIWEGYTVPTTISPRWLRYHFVAPVSVSTVRLVEFCNGCHGAGFYPEDFKEQYSDDNGVTWFDATGNFTPDWTEGGTGGVNISWSFTVDAPLGGYFVNWRIRATNIIAGGFQTAVSELGFKDTVGGGLITSSTNGNYPFSNGDGTCCAVAANLFDLNINTYVDTGVPGLMGYAFEKPYKVIEVDITNLNSSGAPTWAGTSPIFINIEGSNDAGINWFTAFTCIPATWTGQGQTRVCGTNPDQRGNIAYNQIRANDRQGQAHQIQMFGGGATVSGHSAQYDGQGNVIDGGVYTIGRITAPIAHTDPCTVDQIAIDGSANFYWCYSTNLWARIGPGGYSSSF